MASMATIYTVVISAPSNIDYASGATFSGDVVFPVSSTSTIDYTLQQGLHSQMAQQPITLTATISSSVGPGPTISGIITLGSLAPSYAILQISSVSASNAAITSSPSNSTTASASILTNSSTLNSIPASLSTTAISTSSAIVSPASTTSTGSQVNQGHSTVELVGVAIGVLIAGALIATLIMLTIMRRREKRQPRGHDSINRQPSMKQLNEAVISDNKSWQRHLPQSESDHTISRFTTELFDQIELHVENFYADKVVEPQHINSDRPSQLLYEAIRSGLRPTSAIKLVMTNTVLSSINFEGDSNHSLLPTTFNTVRVQAEFKQPGYDQAMSQWRTLTAYLGGNVLQSETYLSDRESEITALANQLCRTFQPWSQGHNKNCYQSTSGILRRGSDLGAMLFSQPASFLWDWGQDQTKRGERKTILPGLFKVTDETAQPLAKHMCLVNRRTGL